MSLWCEDKNREMEKGRLRYACIGREGGMEEMWMGMVSAEVRNSPGKVDSYTSSKGIGSSLCVLRIEVRYLGSLRNGQE